MMVLQQMAIFFLLMLLGIAARKQGMLNEKNQQQISSLVVNIAYPVIILSGVSGSGARMEGEKLLLSFGVALAVLCSALATPSGNMLAMLAAIYNKDSFLLATEGISLTTAVSVVTMPLVAWLAGIG